MAAALLAFTIFFYVVVYTAWLKRRTPQNIVIGGAAGALPPVIGWAAATGDIGLEPLVLFLIIFLWTPPHFWALSLNRSDDYARAGVPMLPVVAGRAATKRQILLYSVLLVPVSLLPCALGFAGALYGAIAAIWGALFVVLALRLSRTREGDRRPPIACSSSPSPISSCCLPLFLHPAIGGGRCRRPTCHPRTAPLSASPRQGRSDMRHGLYSRLS